MHLGKPVAAAVRLLLLLLLLLLQGMAPRQINRLLLRLRRH
jgi:hypothetical protein